MAQLQTHLHNQLTRVEFWVAEHCSDGAAAFNLSFACTRDYVLQHEKVWHETFFSFLVIFFIIVSLINPPEFFWNILASHTLNFAKSCPMRRLNPFSSLSCIVLQLKPSNILEHSIIIRLGKVVQVLVIMLCPLLQMLLQGHQQVDQVLILGILRVFPLI